MSERGDVTVKLVIGIAVLMIIIAAGTSYLFMNMFLDSPDTETAAGENQEIGPTYDLGDFVVNLSGTRGYQIIQADIVVEVSTESTKEDLESRNPQVRDAIIRILRNQTTEDLQDPEIEQLKNEIQRRLNQVITEGEVTDVWFTRMVVQ